MARLLVVEVVVGGKETGGGLSGVREGSNGGSGHRAVVLERVQLAELREVVSNAGERDGDAICVGWRLCVLVALGEVVLIEGIGILEGQQRTLKVLIK
jgi:hypothetical protein